MPVALQLCAWPGPRPHPHREDTKILVDPPLQVDQVSTLLPTDTYSKFFSQAFWKTEYQKYGIQALKVHPDTAGLTVLDRSYTRRKDLTRLFGKSHGNWLLIALTFLRKLGHGLLHAYCRELLHEKMEYRWVRKRFHHECKVWPVRMEAFDKIVEEICNHTSELSRVWDSLNLPEWDRATEMERQNQLYFEECLRNMQPAGNMLNWDTYHAKLYEQMDQTFNTLIGGYKQLHHHLLHEIRCIQTLVVDFVQQGPFIKGRLHLRYVGQLHAKIEEKFEPVILDMLKTLERIRARFEEAAALTEQINDDMQRIHNHLQMDLNHLVQAKFFLSNNNLFVKGLPWQEEMQTIPRGRAKKKSHTMKRMATKELLKAKPVIRQLVETFLAIIDINKDEAKNEEESRSYEVLAEKMKQDMKAHPHRRQQAAGHPGWLLPTPSVSPEPTSAAYARPPGNSVPPWQPGKQTPTYLPQISH